MKFFIDSANIDEIRYSKLNWGIEGVTTNPRHIKNTGRSFGQVIDELAIEFEGENFPISIEVDPYLEKASDMIAAAKTIHYLSDNFVIKIPCTNEGLIAAKKLTEMGINVNVTLVFTASQALQVGRIKAAYVSPFIGWQEAVGVDSVHLLKQITTIYRNYSFSTKIIVASVRNAKQIVDAAIYKADIVTASYSVYKDSFEHPFTMKGLELFQKAWDDIK